MALFRVTNPFGGDDENSMEFFINQSKNNLFRLIDSKETKSQIKYVSNELDKMNLCYDDFEEKYRQVLSNSETDEYSKMDYKNHFQVDILSPISNYVIDLKEIYNQLSDDLKESDNNEIIKTYTFGVHYKNKFVWTGSKRDYASVIIALKEELGIKNNKEIISFTKINEIILKKGELSENDIKQANKNVLTVVEISTRKRAIIEYLNHK
ncbi:MAG TPA: hypothetical protein PKY56_07035 [Candidatus Kapabacteria bacterium]|nr:hypothetical protein [Candidatus Kapabacteria bacterium]